MIENSIKEIPKTQGIYSIGQERFGPDPGTSYLVKSSKNALIEAGTSKSIQNLLRDLEKIGIKTLDYIALTHIHLDHAGGAGFLLENFPEAKVIVHKKGSKHLIDPSKLKRSVKRAVGKLFDLYGDVKPIPSEKIISVSGDREIDLGDNYTLKTIDSPGHAPHHLCYYEKKNKVLFTGDAAGIYYPKLGKLLPSTPPPNFNLEEEISTLEKLKKLPAETIAYTHVGWKENPQKNLENYKKLLEDWVKEIENLRDKDTNKKSIIKKMIKKYADKWSKSREEKEIMREKIKMDVEGVLLYLKKRHEK